MTRMTDEELIRIEAWLLLVTDAYTDAPKNIRAILTECRRARAAEGAYRSKLSAVVRRQAGDFCIGCQKELNTATEGGGA